MFIADRWEGAGSEAIDSGSHVITYDFTFQLTSDTGYPDSGKSAYEKWEALIKLCYYKHETYGYQRRLTFAKPDNSADTSINGKITKLSTTVMEGDNLTSIEGTMSFSPDDVATVVPSA